MDNIQKLINNKNKIPDLKNIKYIVYDLETYTSDFFGVFFALDDRLKIKKVFLIDESFVKQLVDKVYDLDITLVGFNNHFYDDKMLANIYFGRPYYLCSHELINIPFSKASQYNLCCKSLDIFKDVQGSLKYNQAVLGYNIKESGVGFDIDRKLTIEEYYEEVAYCYNDGKTSVDLFRFRMKGGTTSIQNKLNLINDYDLPDSYTRKTDNEIVAHIIGGKPINWNVAYDELFDIETFEKVVSKHCKHIPDNIVQMYRYYHNKYHKEVRTVRDRKTFKKKFTEKNKDNYYDIETRKFLNNKKCLDLGIRRILLNPSFGGSHSMNVFEILGENDEEN